MSEVENPLAFPCHPEITSAHSWGMTLRDYFAGQALAGLLAGSQRLQALTTLAQRSGKAEEDLLAIVAYKFADGLLAHRGKEGPQ